MDSGRAVPLANRGGLLVSYFLNFVGTEGECYWARWWSRVRRRVEWMEGLWLLSSGESDSLSSLSQ